MRGVSGWMLLALVSGCAPASSGDDAGEGESGGTGGPGMLACDDEWVEHVQHPYDFGVSFASDGVFVAVDRERLAIYAGGAWTTEDLGQSVQATAVWADGRDSIWLLDEWGELSRLAHWDGASLSTVLTAGGDDEHFLDIWGSAPDDVWLAGRTSCTGDSGATDCTALLRHFDGSSWTEAEGLEMPGLSVVWGRAPDDVFVSAESGSTAHFDGTKWTQHMTSGVDVTQVSGDEVAVYAVGYPYAYRWHGAGWSVLDAGKAVPAWFDDIAVVGGELWGLARAQNMLYRRDEDGWWPYALWPLEGRSIAHARGELWLTADDATFPGGGKFLAVGVDGDYEVRGEIDHVVAPSILRGDSVEEAYALGFTSTGLAPAVFDGVEWRWLTDDPGDFRASSLFVEAPGVVWTVGQVLDEAPGLGVRRDGPGEPRAWEFPPELGETQLGGLWVTSEEDLWVLGAQGAYHFDGQSWFAAAYPAGEFGIGIVSAGGHTYLLGNKIVFELVNGSWSAMRASLGYRQIDLAAPLSLWVIEIDEQGAYSVVRWDGVEWTSFAVGDFALAALEARAPDDVYVLGLRNKPGGELVQRILHFDGAQWTRIDAPSGPTTQLLATDDGIMLTRYPSTFTLRCERR